MSICFACDGKGWFDYGLFIDTCGNCEGLGMADITILEEGDK